MRSAWAAFWNGGGAGSLRENGRRTDLAFFGRAVGALVHGYLAPVKAVPFRRVAVAGQTIAGHRVGRGTLRGDVTQVADRTSVTPSGLSGSFLAGKRPHSIG